MRTGRNGCKENRLPIDGSESVAAGAFGQVHTDAAVWAGSRHEQTNRAIKGGDPRAAQVAVQAEHFALTHLGPVGKNGKIQWMQIEVERFFHVLYTV